jgi:hypothetical protein
MAWKEQFTSRLTKYKNDCKVIKQINSNKSRKYEGYHNFLNVVTIISSVLLTSLAFVDKKLINQLFFQNTTDTTIIDFAFNITVLVVLLLSIINLIYRFQEKSFEHYRAVIILSGLTRDIDDLINYESYNKEQADLLLTEIRNKYKSILDLLPQNTDKEFLEAKKDIVTKEKEVKKIETETKP